MNDEQLQTIEQVKQFLERSKVLEFRVLSVGEKYNWIEEVLIRFQYHRLKRDEEGGNTKVYRKNYGIFQGTDIQIDKEIQTGGAVEENRIQKAPISQEVYFIRS